MYAQTLDTRIAFWCPDYFRWRGISIDLPLSVSQSVVCERCENLSGAYGGRSQNYSTEMHETAYASGTQWGEVPQLCIKCVWSYCPWFRTNLRNWTSCRVGASMSYGHISSFFLLQCQEICIEHPVFQTRISFIWLIWLSVKERVPSMWPACCITISSTMVACAASVNRAEKE